MDQNDRDLLRSNWVYLIENLDLGSILPLLHQTHVLTRDHIASIEAEVTPSKRVVSFLTHLQRRGTNAFGHLLYALEVTGQTQAKHRLESSRESDRIARKSKSMDPMSSRGSLVCQPQDLQSPQSRGRKSGISNIKNHSTSNGNDIIHPEESSNSKFGLEDEVQQRMSLMTEASAPNFNVSSKREEPPKGFYLPSFLKPAPQNEAVYEQEDATAVESVKQFESENEEALSKSVQELALPQQPEDSHLSALQQHAQEPVDNLPSDLPRSYSRSSSFNHSFPVQRRRSSVDQTLRGFAKPEDIHVVQTESLSLDMTCRLGEGQVYENFSQPKGFCLIINNRQFDRTSTDLDFRAGSDKDAGNLERLFTLMGYSVQVLVDLASEAFQDALDSFADDERHSQCDSAVVCILSHGQKMGVYATDGLVIRFTEILDCFDGVRCPGLVNKPKLFFFQACRGNKSQSGYDVVDGNSSEPASKDASPTSDLSSSSSSSSLAKTEEFYRIDASGTVTVPTGSDDVVDAGIEIPTTLAKYSDMLVAYSTIADHVSIRHASLGSWFVQAVVDVFSEFAAEEAGGSINSLLTKVNRKISKLCTTGGRPRKQMPEPHNHLTRDFYFFPGYYKVDHENAICALFDIGNSQPLPAA